MPDQTLTRELRDALVARYESLNTEFMAGVEADTLGDDEQAEMQEELERLLETYFAGLPRPALSRCPFCDKVLHRSFDPWGVDGFWWQEEAETEIAEPEACPHFGVLQGAVALNGKPPLGGQTFEADIGPGVPFVIPRVLEQPSVRAVVSALTMANGYTAYPIAYFTAQPLPPGSFTQPWTRSSYSFGNGRGGFAWRVDTDPWDFELQPWIRRGKLLWIDPDDASMRLRDAGEGSCPYVGREGTRERQRLRARELWTVPAPEGEEVDPFSG